MKIERFNIPDFNSFNETKSLKNEESNRADFSARLDNTSAANQSPAASPLQGELASIAKSTDFNNSISSRVAIDKATRTIVDGLVSPELKGRIDMDAMLSTLSDFAQNDPVVSQRLQKLLIRLS
jgi:hypothetical protein